MDEEIRENLYRVIIASSVLLLVFLLLVFLVALETDSSFESALGNVIYSLETFNFVSKYGPLVLFFSLFLGGLATYILEFLINVLRKGVGGALYMRQFIRMKDHFIIIGGGRIGTRIAENLYKAGRKFIIIEKDENRAIELKNMKFRVYLGDGTSEKVLKRVGIEKARGVFCCLGEDVSNLVAAINARSMNKDAIIISRCNSPSNASKFKAFGVDYVMLPEIIGADSMFEAMEKAVRK